MSTSSAPDWATWSLKHDASAEGQAAGPSRLSRTAEDASTVTSLLRDHDDAKVYQSQWQEFKADDGGRRPTMTGAAPRDEDVHDVEALINAVGDEPKVKVEPCDPITTKKVRTATRKTTKTFRYDPLTRAETDTLLQCLKLSKYVDKDSPTYMVPSKRRRLEKESQKYERVKDRDSATPTPDDDVDDAEATYAKASFESMLTTFMPTRNVDWIMINMKHARGLLGLESIVRKPRQRKGIDAISHLNNGTLPPENAALALFALAQASGLAGLHKIRLSEPEPLTSVEDQREEAEGVIRSFKALFPTFFPHDAYTEESVDLTKKMIRDSHSELVKAFFEYSAQSGHPKLRRVLETAQVIEPGGSRIEPAAEHAEEEKSDASDWAEVEYSQGPFAGPSKNEFEQLPRYEQALVAFGGKIPQRIRRKLRREGALPIGEISPYEQRYHDLETQVGKLKEALVEQRKKHEREMQNFERKRKELDVNLIRSMSEAERRQALADEAQRHERQQRQRTHTVLARKLKHELIKHGLYVQRGRGRPPRKTAEEKAAGKERQREIMRKIEGPLRRKMNTSDADWNETVKILEKMLDRLPTARDDVNVSDIDLSECWSPLVDDGTSVGNVDDSVTSKSASVEPARSPIAQRRSPSVPS